MLVNVRVLPVVFLLLIHPKTKSGDADRKNAVALADRSQTHQRCFGIAATASNCCRFSAANFKLMRMCDAYWLTVLDCRGVNSSAANVPANS